MIIYERTDDFVMIKQHVNQAVFLNPSRKEDVLYSISEHDRGWIDLDDVPLWNDRAQRPYSFMDLPSHLKLTFYRKGIDEVEQENRYAALLCSLHFVSFYEGDEESTSQQFVSDEKVRQENLKKQEDITRREGEKELLGFFDNVNHTLLMKQLWNMGIQDRKVLACISKMLKAEIDGEGIPIGGVPQGGLLSTLLSNIVLNDLDHWVAGQWEFFPLTQPHKTRSRLEKSYYP